jgi:hypothetical protein
MYQAGEIHDLTGIVGTDTNGKETTLEGRYELVEFCPREPSAYVWSDLWVVIPESVVGKENWEDYIFDIDAFEIWAKLDPEGYKSYMEQERLMDMEEIEREQNANHVYKSNFRQ